MKIVLLALLILSSCSSFKESRKPYEGQRSFIYIDVSGKFKLQREHKLAEGKLLSRSTLAQYDDKQKLLEKSVIVSQLGTIKDGDYRSLVLRPLASDYIVWLEGKRNEIKLRLDEEKKAFKFTQITPEGEKSSYIPVIKGQTFCFFNQISECLFHNNLLIRSLEKPDKEFTFNIIWDSYPITQDLLSGIGKKLFSEAVIKFEGKKGNELSYQVEVEGQVIIYQFSKSFDLVRMLWILQGISILPPGEEPAELEE